MEEQVQIAVFPATIGSHDLHRNIELPLEERHEVLKLLRGFIFVLETKTLT